MKLPKVLVGMPEMAGAIGAGVVANATVFGSAMLGWVAWPLRVIGGLVAVKFLTGNTAAQPNADVPPVGGAPVNASLATRVAMNVAELTVGALGGATAQAYVEGQNATPLTYLRGAAAGVGMVATGKLLAGITEPAPRNRLG